MSQNRTASARLAEGSTFPGAPVSLESILCTDELERRPPRAPDFEAENHALTALAQALADSPRSILQTLADTILDVLRSDSAGISLLTEDEKRFYWPAIAGVWKPHIGGGTPRDFGPCGDVLDRNMPLMFRHVERRYDYFLPVTPPVEECLLVPFYVQAKAVGTIWAIAHSERRKFDAEDMRQLVSLARFASSAYQVIQSLDLMEKHAAELRDRGHSFREMSNEAEIASKRLAAIVESSDDAIISKTLDGIITSWNRGAEDIFGYTAAEAVGQSISLIIPLERRAEEDDVLAHLRRGEKIDHFETERQTKDGRRLNVSLTISPIKDSTGRIVGASKVARDITERKRAEEQLLEAKRIAEAASHAKDKFLAALSHELRTPLTPVLMAVAAMDMNSDLASELRDDMAMIRRNVELEAKLIDDLLDLSLALSGKLRLNLETVELNQVVHHVCEICRPFVLEKGINLHCDLPNPSPFVKADPARLQQVLWNLLKNAAKFTPERGDIFVSALPTVENRVSLQVRDSGIGMAPDVLPCIFDAFEQGDDDITREFGGMGLGLAIAKNLVELHHGTIRAESSGPKQGATFTIEFPLVSKNVDESARPADGASESGATLRILFVDDNADTAFVLSKFLTASGYVVKTAGSAAAALELASKEPFDIIVSDIGLPDVSGYELMKQIRAYYPIQGIAMSGYGMEDDLRKSREAGFSDHIVKPASLSQLERSIHRLRSNLVKKPITTT